MTRAIHSASTRREGGPSLPREATFAFNRAGHAICQFETILLSAANGTDSARKARVRRNRSSIQESGALAEAVCSKRNLSAQATTGRNSNWS